MTVGIALTPGEPAGIGPDIAIALAQSRQTCELVAVADPELLKQRAAALGLPLVLQTFDPDAPSRPSGNGKLTVLPVALAAQARPGRLTPVNADYVLEAIRRAVGLCQAGQCAALVTGPVHKGNIQDAGYSFTGHTEYLAQLTTTALPVMLLAAPDLRVALATTHLPLRAVPNAISKNLIVDILRVLDRDLRTRFGISRPSIAVAGLNPHAGEDGYLGLEEIDIIKPALETAAQEGIDATGPWPADTLFTPPMLKKQDTVLAMYHDQGLPVLKHLGFGRAVNITLGLPIIRTSVDHGTALDLAGSGRADPGSLQAAVDMAQALSATD